MSGNELRAVLARLPHRRLAVALFAERRDDLAVGQAWRDLWGLLAAELADVLAEERAVFQASWVQRHDDGPEGVS